VSQAHSVAPSPRPLASRAGPRLWLIGSSIAGLRAARLLEQQARCVVRHAMLDDVLASATIGDRAIIAGLSPMETVETADALVSRGIPIAIDVSNAPVLGNALGKHVWSGCFVLIDPPATAAPSGLMMRLRDVLLAGMALAASAPAIGVLAAVITRTSAGPAFFATIVVGRDGKTFVWRKLRTMHVGAPADDARRRDAYRRFLLEQPALGQPASGDHAVHANASGGANPSVEHAPRKLVDERRVTLIGRFLRRHSIDELPQLWNVLRGEMTLVGPRPCLPYEYELQAPWQRLRFRVTPGLTGPWQAYGRSRLTFDEMALMDYCYGFTKSFGLDARLIFRTARVVLTGEGGK
jgi:lipopolysaccharide/colanic/teichoic acid biosynthesis glycosyltransferase